TRIAVVNAFVGSLHSVNSHALGYRLSCSGGRRRHLSGMAVYQKLRRAMAKLWVLRSRYLAGTPLFAGFTAIAVPLCLCSWPGHARRTASLGRLKMRSVLNFVCV